MTMMLLSPCDHISLVGENYLSIELHQLCSMCIHHNGFLGWHFSCTHACTCQCCWVK